MGNSTIGKAVAIGLCLLTTAAQAESKFSITNLSFLSPQSTARWMSVNDNGDLLGSIGNLTYVYGSGTLQQIPATDAYSPSLLNNNGIVTFAKAAESPAAMQRAYYYSNGTMKEVTPLYDNIYRGGTFIADINDAGAIVGTGSHYNYDCHTGDPGCEFRSPWNRAILYQNGKTVDLGTLHNSNQASASAINNAGTVVGTSAGEVFAYYGGAMHGLGIESSGYALRINDAGQIAGSSWQNSNQAAWVYDHGQLTTVGLADRANRVVDLNNAGQIIGTSATWDKPGFWLYTGGQTIDINTLLYEEDWTITGVIDLNDQGQILATATREGRGTAYVLLTPDQAPVLLPPALPVPEPGTYAMLIGGLGVLAAWRRRQA